MLKNQRAFISRCGRPATRQRGMVMMIALIVLVAMTLGGIALVRSVDTTNIIAGNMAFQQSSVHSGDRGIEEAINYLWVNRIGTGLHYDAPPGYHAIHSEPATGQSWDTHWTSVLGGANNVNAVLVKDPAGNDRDDAGNKVYRVIQRLCGAPGDPTSVLNINCAQPLVNPAAAPSSNSKGAGVIALAQTGGTITQIYYRITTRIEGPRNTVSYVQAIVVL